jgi:hypothetical protein
MQIKSTNLSASNNSEQQAKSPLANGQHAQQQVGDCNDVGQVASHMDKKMSVQYRLSPLRWPLLIGVFTFLLCFGLVSCTKKEFNITTTLAAAHSF